MKLQNKHIHMRGKSVLCNGTTYKVDKDGTMEVSKKADAARLLADPAWSVYRKPAKPAKKAGAQKGPQMPPPAEPQDDPQGEPAEEPQEPENEPQGDPTEAGEGEPADEEPTGEGEGGEEPAGESTGEEDPNAWPDPDMSMNKPYLQEMADAYEVGGWEEMTKQELVDAIKGKMYG